MEQFLRASTTLLRPLFRVAADCSNLGTKNAVDLGTCLQLGNGQSVQNVYTNPAFLVNLIVRNLFVAAGVIFFVMIFWAGFKMIQGGKKGFEEAKTIITTAVIGIIIMICAYWIVQLVGYITGVSVSL